jgi:hypothetical protein
MEKFERLPDMACEVTPELKQRIADVNREAHALHLAVFPTVYVGAKVTDFDGNVLMGKEYKANSFNRNFYNFLFSTLCGASYTDTSSFAAGHINLRDIYGTIIASNNNYQFYGMGARNNSNGIPLVWVDVQYGIEIGSGTGIESFDDYKLINKIQDGTSAGRMTYLVGINGGAVYDSEQKKWTITFYRICKNTSGGTVSVTESGLYSKLEATSVSMWEHTVFPSAIEVPNGSQIEVTYTFEFTYPEP